jgi:DNA polymerase IV
VAQAPRKIIHVDMDAFYASVEQRDDPRLRGRPVIVGGSPDSRGVVAACSYEARTFGVRSAMPTSKAARLCPSAVFVRPRMSRYVQVSQQIRGIFRSVTDLVEPLSLDEAYLDVTVNHVGEALAGRLAREIKHAIKAQTGLTASAGVGPSKLVAKIASDVNKPDGLCIVPPEDVLDFLAPLPVTRLWGVGPKTAERLSTLNVKTVADVRRLDPTLLEERLGRYGAFLYALAFGDDPRAVEVSRAPKSRGSETTFASDVTELSVLLETLRGLCDDVALELAGEELRARTVTLKLRYADFETLSRARTMPAPSASERDMLPVLKRLYREARQRTLAIRLLGVAASNLVLDEQLPLFPEDARVRHSVDALRERFGFDAVRIGTGLGTDRDEA